MNYQIQMDHSGGPEVLGVEEVPVEKPARGEVRLRQTAVGLNYIDVYHRTGLYPVELPAVPGLEAAGVVEAVGEGVSGLQIGDRVACGTGPLGAYTASRVMPASKLVRIPEGISDEQAAGAMLKGMTAEYLLCRTFPVKKGDVIVFHAAAGGVGLIACQWAASLGVEVIGTVGSPQKAKLAREYGCRHVILYREENVEERVLEITGGRGVPVVYDSVGRDTFQSSLNCLEPRGMLVSYGQSSGSVPAIDLKVFAPKSLFYTRPSLFNYAGTRRDLEASSRRLFEKMLSGDVKIRIGASYALKDAAQAHRDLEGRKLTGSTLLIP